VEAKPNAAIPSGMRQFIVTIIIIITNIIVIIILIMRCADSK